MMVTDGVVSLRGVVKDNAGRYLANECAGHRLKAINAVPLARQQSVARVVNRVVVERAGLNAEHSKTP